MANEPSSSTGNGLPIPYLTAAWAGMSQEDIAAGVRAGQIFDAPDSFAEWRREDTASPNANVRSLPADLDPFEPSVDRARVQRWFESLDADLSAESFDSIWTRAGNDDGARAANLTHCLASTLLGRTDAKASRSSIPEALDDYVTDPAHRASVVDLTSRTGAELAELAQGDIGYRYALANLQPFALTDNRSLFAGANADGRYDRFDPDTGEALISDAWLGDRGKFLAWKTASESGGEMAIAGTADWTFVDHSLADSNGEPLTIKLKTGAPDASTNQVVFGSDDADILKGVSGSDRMYGGGGDDVLRGGGGGDHLEGGAGDDLVMGGAGADELIGNQGGDELDGGNGNDTLAGCAGADVLEGGRGDDRLEGGTGDDVYAIESDDGEDTIVDADGLGAIELDGVQIDGAMTADGDKWRSSDQRLEFTLSGDEQDGHTLTIKSFADGAMDGDAPTHTLNVKDWKNGDLGITLAGVPTTDHPHAEPDGGPLPESTASASSSEGQEVPAEESAADPTGGSNGAPAEEDVLAQIVAPTDPAEMIGGSLVGEAGVPTFDFDGALDALLGTNDAVAALDSATVQNAIEAFSGVLEAPDVSALLSNNDVTGAVTANDIADALANDVSGEDLEAELGMAVVGPDINTQQPPVDAAAKLMGVGNGMGQGR